MIPRPPEILRISTLPYSLTKMMGGEPTEDDALVSAIKEIGRSHEECQEEK